MEPTHERELTEPVDLCRPDGRLSPSAVGWSRYPVHRANLRGWGRAKRWEYWGIVTETHIIGIVASSLDYVGLHGVYLLDRRDGTEPFVKDVVVPLAGGSVQPAHSGVGTVRARGGGVDIAIGQRADGSHLRVRAAGLRLDARVPLPPGHESLGVVIPWSPRRFQLTVKDIGRPVTGTLRIGGETVALDGPTSFAVLDHGRGKWPYRAMWNWAAGAAPGFAVQFGGRWTDGTGLTENAVLVDGRLHKIGEELRWDYDPTDWLRPWRIDGERVDVEFTPFHLRAARSELLLVGNRTHQCFGHFTGRIRTDDGVWRDLPRLTGWAEEARNRW